MLCRLVGMSSAPHDCCHNKLGRWGHAQQAVRALHRSGRQRWRGSIGEALPACQATGRVSRLGDDAYAAATAIWANPVGPMPQRCAVKRSEKFGSSRSIRTMVRLSTLVISESSTALAVDTRCDRPVKQPSPIKSPALSNATTASLPWADKTAILTRPSRM
jgi:hypothetical protein